MLNRYIMSSSGTSKRGFSLEDCDYNLHAFNIANLYHFTLLVLVKSNFGHIGLW